MAHAIKHGLQKRGFTSVSLHVEDSAILPYVLYYRYAPFLNSVFNPLIQTKLMTWLIRFVLHYSYYQKIRNLVANNKPEIVISTNYALNGPFEWLHAKRMLKYFNVVCDPKTHLKLNISHKRSVNLVFDSDQVASIQKDYPRAKCAIVGWFVRPEFHPPKSLEQAKREVGIDPNIFCVLLVSGSEGMQKVQNIVLALVKQSTPMTLIVACGKNRILKLTIEQLAKVYANSQVRIVALGYTEQIATYYQAADSIVGKAGPNMLFEAVACHKPFLATTSLQGQEAGNFDLIQELGIGFIETNSAKAAELIVDLANNQEKIEAVLPNIKKLAEYNKASIDRLVEIVKS